MNRNQRYAVAAVALFLLAGGALAGTTGTEFQALYTWVNDVVTGYFGRAVAVAAVGLGAILSIARVNPVPILSGAGFAIFLQYTPTIITGILTATV
ncbi:MAG: TraA family conjugative transfer protein [Candidatus Paceibacterota bacterium]